MTTKESLAGPPRPAGTRLTKGARWGTQFYCYVAAVLSVIVTLAISQFLDCHMITSAPIALFLCAIMFSTWYGGLKPGFLAMALSLLAFKYYYLPPIHSLAVAIHEIPRLLINILASFFVVSLGAAQRKSTELLRDARNVLDGTLQDLKRSNESLQEENTMRKQVEETVKTQAQVLIDAIPQQIWSGPPDGTLDYGNDRWRSYRGLALEELRGTGWQVMIHPDDLDRVIKAWHESVAQGTPYEQEERHRGTDGNYRWFLVRGLPLRDAEGRITRWYGTNTDIEDQKHAEQMLRDSGERLRALTARLESLREEERMRISREIHDELGQNLTGLKMNLLRAERKLEELETSIQVNTVLDTIVSATSLVDELVANVQQIATELRPGVLDKLGLGSALQYEARHFLQSTGIAWEVRQPETEPDLSEETSITLFRIFQECLTNIVRHAHATKVEAELEPEDGWVTLRVQDNGRGITETEITNPKSLGLLGMKERTVLLGGGIAFQRGTNGGTIVTARVPKKGTFVQMKGIV